MLIVASRCGRGGGDIFNDRDLRTTLASASSFAGISTAEREQVDLPVFLSVPSAAQYPSDLILSFGIDPSSRLDALHRIPANQYSRRRNPFQQILGNCSPESMVTTRSPPMRDCKMTMPG